MPPLIEYIDALLTGTGEATSLQTFKVIDQQSGRTLGVRADMTPQVARIDAHVLRQDAPSRLCYTGTVLRARTDGFGGSRTPQQFGAELFGHSEAAADIEIIRLMLDTAELGGLPPASLILDLGHVGVFQGLCAAADFTEAQQADVFDAMHRGSLPDIHAVLRQTQCSAGLYSAFESLLELRGGVDVIERAKQRLLTDDIRAAMPAASGLSFIESALQALEQTIEAIKISHPDIQLVIDLAELRGYHYHTGMLFATYTENGDVIARGGRYDAIGTAFGRVRPATGFSGDLTQLAWLAAASNSTSSLADDDGVFVPSMDTLSAAQQASLWVKVRALRQAGERVVMALPNDTTTPQAVRCARQLNQRDGVWCVEPVHA